MDKVTLLVPQGVGDIFWCYQKVAPYVDRIDFQIAYTDKVTDVSRRAVQFLHTWPRTGEVCMFHVEPSEYKDIWTSTPDSPYPRQSRAKYAVNAPLEAGIRLEAIHPGSKIDWNVPVAQEKVDLPDKYICVYVSGNAKKNSRVAQWDVREWHEFILGFAMKHLGHKLVIIGAEFDKPMVDDLMCVFGEQLATPFIGESAEKVMYILDNAAFFIGYQSGLGILADNLKTPQLMMYFQELDKMKYTWCQPYHKNDVFWADTFDRSPKQVLDDLKWEPK